MPWVVKGPSVPLKWADIVDADAETARAKALADAGEPADPTHHTTVGAIEMKLTDDKHHVGYVWVDLVPRVALQGSKADVEEKPNASGKVIARAALDRLEAGLSRLMGVVADGRKDPDLTLDPASGTLTGAGTDAHNLRLYMSVKPYAGRFIVDDNPHKKHADGAWMLAPPEAKGVELYALATTNGAGGTHDALVEVLYGVLASDVDAENKSRLDEATADNDARVQIVQDLLGAKVVDVRDRLATRSGSVASRSPRWGTSSRHRNWIRAPPASTSRCSPASRSGSTRTRPSPTRSSPSPARRGSG